MFWFSIPAWSTIPECSGWKHSSVYFSTGFQFWPCVPGLACLCPRWYCVSFMWLACWYWVLDGKGPQFSLYWAFLQGCLGLLTAWWLAPRRMKGHLPVLSKAGACTDMPRFGHVLWVNAITGPGQAQGCGEIDVISWWPEWQRIFGHL